MTNVHVIMQIYPTALNGLDSNDRDIATITDCDSVIEWICSVLVTLCRYVATQEYIISWHSTYHQWLEWKHKLM